MVRDSQPQRAVSSGESATDLTRDDDAAQVARIRAGDAAAFRTLVDRLHAPLVRLARAYVASDAVAQDVVQETWLAVVRGISQFEGRSSLKTWVFGILANRARTRATREQRNVSLDEAHLGESSHEAELFTGAGAWRQPPRSWEGRDGESAALDREFMEQLRRALETLPANQRIVVTLRDVEGLSSEEVCNVLGIAETNQRVLLHRARTKLRAALDEYVTAERR